MTDMMSLKETSTRQLRQKLASLGRLVDELEDATRSLHRMEDEIMDLQDKVIQAEGSNSGLLSEVDLLRRRVLAVEGKDEEVRKAEEMCRRLKEKLEGEARLSRELRAEVDKLQGRMAELEKLEEAFGRSKSDCTQLSLSLNEEKNLTRKLTAELELLRSRVKELESTEHRLDKSEKSILAELEKLKSLTVVLAEERKATGDTLQASERRIRELTTKLEMTNRISSADQGKNSSNLRANVNEKTYGYTGDLMIEGDMSTELGKGGGLDSITISHNVGLRKKVGQEDNKIKDLTQEIERLKKRLTLLEMVEEDLKKTEAKHNELQERFLSEQSLAKLLGHQLEEMKEQMSRERAVGNGETHLPPETRHRSRPDKPKYRGVAVEEPPVVAKERSQEVFSSQPRSQREKVRNRDLLPEDDHGGKGYRRPLSPSVGRRFQRASSNPRAAAAAPSERRSEQKAPSPSREQKNQEPLPEKARKARDPPAVLSRYPPAANESNGKRPWGAHGKASVNGTRGNKAELDDGDLEQAVLSDRQRKGLSYTETPGHERPAPGDDVGEEPAPTITGLLNGTSPAGRNHSAPPTTSDSGARNSYVVEFEVPPEEVPGGAGTPITTSRSRRSKYQRSSSRSHSQDLGLEYTAARCVPVPEDKQVAEVGLHQLEVRRVCSPREGLRSKAVIKPAIIAIDKKEVMSTGAETGAGGQRSPPRPGPNKVTSSITIPPSELSSQRPGMAGTTKEIHTSTSNITIGTSDNIAHRSNLTIPYEISIHRSDITVKMSGSGSDSSDEDGTESVSGLSVSTRVGVKVAGGGGASEQDLGGSPSPTTTTTTPSYRRGGQDVDGPDRSSWRSGRASEVSAEPAKREKDLGLDYSRLANRRTGQGRQGGESAGGGAALSEGYTRRLSNFSNSSDSSESRRSSVSEPGRSYLPMDTAARRRQHTASVASKVADWNNSCTMTGQDSSDLLSALNSSVMSKRKEMAKQILSELVTERVPRADPAGKRQSVKLELRRNAEGSPTHSSGSRSEDTTPVGILSQMRMTSRR
ncbi:leucine zipper protein 1 [Leucoraja erinacea]|uniref:leucine zipper protein 1 n=1 Tax=Leucoraja erinaceus TaxID=7782 RepID=UPI00245635BC|nr:leucine zipper protein 1 [Leucoraja erinacea]